MRAIVKMLLPRSRNVIEFDEALISSQSKVAVHKTDTEFVSETVFEDKRLEDVHDEGKAVFLTEIGGSFGDAGECVEVVGAVRLEYLSHANGIDIELLE